MLKIPTEKLVHFRKKFLGRDLPVSNPRRKAPIDENIVQITLVRALTIDNLIFPFVKLWGLKWRFW